MCLTVLHANSESKMPGMNSNKKITDKKPKNGKATDTVTGLPGSDEEVETAVTKKKASTKTPRNPAITAKT